MEEKFNKFADRIAESLDKWLEDFEKNPVRTVIKVIILLWLIREGYSLWKSTFPKTGYR